MIELLDEDIQTIRDAIKTAPEYVKDHFETLVDQHEMFSARCEELTEQVKTHDDEVEELEAERDEAQESLKAIEEEHSEEIEVMESALYQVKYWLHDFFYLRRVTKSARDVLTIVEDAI